MNIINIICLIEPSHLLSASAVIMVDLSRALEHGHDHRLDDSFAASLGLSYMRSRSAHPYDLEENHPSVIQVSSYVHGQERVSNSYVAVKLLYTEATINN